MSHALSLQCKAWPESGALYPSPCLLAPAGAALDKQLASLVSAESTFEWE